MAASKAKLKAIRSSLPYQFLLYFNGWYFALFFLAEIGIFIWKGVILPYPVSVYVAEIILVFIIVLAGAIQIQSGKQGNLTERLTATLISFALAAPVIAGTLYLLLWQTYVLWLEVVIIAIEMVFLAFELIFGIVCLITFARAPVA